MTLTAAQELTSGARFYVTQGAIKIKYHALGVDVDFSDAPEITRADGMIAFDSEAGTTRERCSITPVASSVGLATIVNFISVEDIV